MDVDPGRFSRRDWKPWHKCWWFRCRQAARLSPPVRWTRSCDDVCDRVSTSAALMLLFHRRHNDVVCATTLGAARSFRLPRTSYVHTAWVNLPWGFLTFPRFKRLGIFSPNFTRLLYVSIYARQQIFIQSSATLTKLCHIKRDHPIYIIIHKMSTIDRNAHTTWPFDSPYAIHYWLFIGAQPLSPTIFEIFASKYIRMTTLTF